MSHACCCTPADTSITLADVMQIGEEADAIDELTEEEFEAFAYVVNALVDLDGGTGIDRAFIVGTVRAYLS